jgi:hypothetical protein
MARIVAERPVEHLERSGFVIMKKPPIGGGATIGRGFDLPQRKRPSSMVGRVSSGASGVKPIGSTHWTIERGPRQNAIGGLPCGM